LRNLLSKHEQNNIENLKDDFSKALSTKLSVCEFQTTVLAKVEKVVNTVKESGKILINSY
jgi:hypothetical protein